MSALFYDGFDDDMSLAQARELLRTLVDEGHRCPCCSQFAKVYRRKIHSTMARELIHFYRRAGLDWFDLPLLAGECSGRRRAYTGDSAKLRYWGLLVENEERRDDGGRAGWWHVTDKGARWVLRSILVPKYARIYDSRCLALDGDPVSIVDALGDRFDYRELMET
jgi:hypothetical protein